jgi:glutamyl-tRNA synthetase
MDELAERYQVKRNAQAAARVAVTGRSAGPPLFEVLEVMGRDESLRRLRAGLARLS